MRGPASSARPAEGSSAADKRRSAVTSAPPGRLHYCFINVSWSLDGVWPTRPEFVRNLTTQAVVVGAVEFGSKQQQQLLLLETHHRRTNELLFIRLALAKNGGDPISQFRWNANLL